MKNKIIIAIIILNYFSFGLISQNPGVSPSTFFYNPSKYNSAFIGGDYTNLNLFSRHQWIGMNNYFESHAFSVDMPIRTITGLKGFGFSVLQTRGGDGNLETLNLSQMTSFRILIKKNIWLSMGLRLSYIHSSINWANLVFTSQIHPIHGTIYPQPSIINTDIYKTNTLSTSTGFTLKHQYLHKTSKNTITNVIGANFEYLTQTELTSFVNNDINIPMLLTFNYGNLILHNSGFIKSIESAVIYERQSKVNTFLFGSNITIRRYKTFEKNLAFKFGLWSRISKKDSGSLALPSALILTCGLQNIISYNRKKKSSVHIDIAYSYDLEIIDKFRPGATHEINLFIYFKKNNKKGKFQKNQYGF